MKQAQPGQTAAEFAGELLVAAYLANGEVEGRFNQFTFVARPGMIRSQVMNSWFEHQRRSYFGEDR